MKLPIFIICILLYIQQIAAQNTPHSDITPTYEEFLQRIIDKDTTIKTIYKEYKCSKDFFGQIRFFFEEDALQLIEHNYKPGLYDDYITEYYYLQQGAFVLQTEITRIIHLNTQSLQDKYNTSFSAEKVLEVIEKRTFLDSNTTHLHCYQRSHGMKSAQWDQAYYNTLQFNEISCSDEPKFFLDDLTYKYLLLRKAEKKLKNYRNTDLQCIFHLW